MDYSKLSNKELDNLKQQLQMTLETIGTEANRKSQAVSANTNKPSNRDLSIQRKEWLEKNTDEEKDLGSLQAALLSALQSTMSGVKRDVGVAARKTKALGPASIATDWIWGMQDTGENPIKQLLNSLMQGTAKATGVKTKEELLLEALGKAYPELNKPTPADALMVDKPVAGLKKYAGLGTFQTPFGKYYIDASGAFRRK